MQNGFIKPISLTLRAEMPDGTVRDIIFPVFSVP
jgi:hypothetical protein